MKHIVANIRPFVIEQEVCVYDEGECINITKCKISDVKDNIIALAQEYNIKQVDLNGKNNPYNQKIQEDLVSTKFSKYKFEVILH